MVNEIAKIVVEKMVLHDVKFEYTGGKKGWKGDTPVVRFNLEKIYKLGWRAKYNSEQAVRKSMIDEMLSIEAGCTK